jgi:hypothetical protein
MKAVVFAILIFTGIFAAPYAQAQVEHQLVRRVVVFPFKLEPEAVTNSRGVNKKEIESAGEDAWWQVREELTVSRRFLVASKQFLIKSDVYAPRGDLQPADTVILGKLLDAHALITGQLKGRSLSMQVYDGSSGIVLWRKDATVHPSLKVSDQLPVMARKLINDFIASIPYQAFQTVDPLVGKAVYEEGDVNIAQIDVGVSNKVAGGDPVQWIRVTATNAEPLFQGGAKVSVFAEGRVMKVDQGVAIVEVLRIAKGGEIKEFSLVRLPREYERLQNEFAMKDAVRSNLSIELVAPEVNPMEQITKERRPLVSTVSWLSSLAAILLLAF